MNANGDGSDILPGDGACEANTGHCTLRAALEELNALSISTVFFVRFTEPMVITVPGNRPLPALRKNFVRIQGGATDTATAIAALRVRPDAGQASGSPLGDGAAALSFPCQPRVTIQGPGGQTTLVGLELSGARSAAVEGLVIRGFAVGLLVRGGAKGNRIGADGSGERDAEACNVIAGNRDAQVQIAGSDTGTTWISGNHIGVGADGSLSGFVNPGNGVEVLDGASNNDIGVRGRDAGVQGLGNVIQGGHVVGVLVSGSASQDNRVAGNLIGAGDPSGWPGLANHTGILIADGATRTTVGVESAAAEPRSVEANQIQHNLVDGLVVDGLAASTTVRGNVLRHNGRDGVRLAFTRSSRTTLRGNAITANGGAAIAIEPLGAQLQVPQIQVVDVAAGTASGQACPSCTVELFADAADEAGHVLGTAAVQDNGRWSLAGLDLAGLSAANLTATVTDRGGSTSVLSAPAPLTEPWGLVEAPAPDPGLGAAPERAVQRYRLKDAAGAPVAGATLRLAPLDTAFATDADGLVALDFDVAATVPAARSLLSLSLSAVGRDGTPHAVTWYPALALGRQRAPESEGDEILSLGGLGARGLGATVRLAAARQAQDRSSPPAALGQAAPAGYGAAVVASPAGQGEGPRSWQRALARGGSIYALHLSGDGGKASLEIAAPAEAYNTGGAASRCPNAPSGAIAAGWNSDEASWVPIAGTVINPPPPGAATFRTQSEITLPDAGTRVRRALSADDVTASAAITLYTVGFDIAPPVISPSIDNGTTLTALPAVLATALDALAGVKALTGVQATLRGIPVPVTYDVATAEIRVPDGARALPPGDGGPARLVLTATDGFCNPASVTIDVILNVEAGTPTVSPTASRTAAASPSATPSDGTPGTPIAPTPTRTASPSPTATPTRGTAPPASPSPSPTRTPTRSATEATPTGTPVGPGATRSPTPSRTPSGPASARIFLPIARMALR